MSVKLERLNNTFVEKISEILHDEVKEKEAKFATITEFRITNDLSYMTIYYTYYQGDEKEYQQELEASKGYLRSELCKKLKARKMPELIFKRDTSLDNGNRILELLQSINNNDNN